MNSAAPVGGDKVFWPGRNVTPPTGTAPASKDIMLTPAAGTKIPAGRPMDATVTITSEWTNSHPGCPITGRDGATRWCRPFPALVAEM